VLYEALVLKCKVGFLRFPDFNMDINFSNEKQLEVYKIVNFESLDSFLNNKISWPFLQMDFDFSISEVSKILKLDKI
jgi:hypothetical protein